MQNLGPAPEAMSNEDIIAKFDSEFTKIIKASSDPQHQADRQIAITKNALGWSAAQGVLLVANNNHTALDPWHIIDRILKNPEYTSINAGVLFAGNLGACVPGSTQRIEYWVEFHKVSASPATLAFLSTLRVAWFEHISRLFGVKIAEVGLDDLAAFAHFESR